MGASAGTHIATSNVKDVEYFDNNNVNLKDFKGLNFYSGIIICHYNNDRQKVYQELKRRRKFIIETLTDEEVLFYNNNIWEKY